MPAEILIQAAADAAITGVTQSIRKNQNINMDEYLVNACGERPFFVGNRRKEWDSCARAARANAPAVTFDTPPNFNMMPPDGRVNINQGDNPLGPPVKGKWDFKNLTNQQKAILFGGGAVVLLGAIYLISKKKK
jgi:hypothetical protein